MRKIFFFAGFHTMLSELDSLPSIQVGDYTLRFELDELSPKSQEIAAKELRESPENKAKGINELRELLKQGERRNPQSTSQLGSS